MDRTAGAKKMTRPTSIEDLDDYDRKGHRVATITSTYITRYPSLGMHLLAALTEASRLGLDVDDEEITIPLTEGELAANIKRAQDSWDRGKAMYDKYLEDREWPKYPSTWFAYLKTEGIAIPNKEEASA
jgi:hypothetical protein